MLVRIEADEVDEFSSAVAGVPVEYVRTDAGSGPCCLTAADTGDVRFATGSMGFSALAGAEIPASVGIFALISAAPPGSRWCGTELVEGQVYFLAPGTSFMGVEPEGLRVSLATVRSQDVERVADDQCRRLRQHSVAPLEDSLRAEQLRRMMTSATRSPESVFDAGWGARALEAGAAALFVDARAPSARRLDSRVIVGQVIDFVEATQNHRPTMRELCRVSHTSESRVRQAFVDVFDAPPTQYFQRRLLSRMRNDLLNADTGDSVTDVAISLGVTQFGRLAGRYRRTFDELPSETLKRRTPSLMGRAAS